MSESISLEELERRWNSRPWYIKIYKRIKYTLKSWLDIPYHIRRLKWFYQRGKRGYADCDWWSLDRYLVQIIIPMLKRMRKDAMGYPGTLTESTWNDKLDLMIEGFEAAERVFEEEYDTSDMKEWIKQERKDVKLFEKRMKAFTKYFFGLWD